MTNELNGIQTALSELLGALGFTAMARDVATETEWATLSKYARIVVKNSPEHAKRALTTRFYRLRLL